MDPLDFSEIAELLNHSRTVKIDLKPVKEQPQNWALYSGQYKVHISTYPFKVLYLHSAATRNSIYAAHRLAFDPNDTQVVYAPSLDQQRTPGVHRELFATRAKGFWTTREYLASFIKEELEVYVSKLRGLSPKFYIDPRVETPAGFIRKRPNPVLSLLMDRDPGCGIQEGMLGILLAEPGQGKTYMSYDLVSALCKGKTVPLYIDSTQWSAMSLEDIGSLWKTIIHSFRHFDAPIGWLEGQEDKFLRAALKAELFRIVFDGFDEYILWNRGQIQAIDVLEALSRLVATTGARIVITSRTSFWQMGVPEDEAREFLKHTKSAIYTILPFDQQHARNYFSNRFSDESKTNRAVTLYTSLGNDGHELMGRGFVLNLVADLVERMDEDVSLRPFDSNAIEWLMDALCKRETLRQQLPLSSKEQIQAFRRFAIEVARGALPSTEMLQLAINEVAPHLEQKELDDCIEKFKSHPLINKEPRADRWSWLQEQVEVVLLADYLVASAREPESSSKAIAEFVQRGNLSEGRRNDLAAMTVDLVRSRSNDKQAQDEIQAVVGVLLAAGASPEEAMWGQGGSRRLAVAIALIVVDSFLPKGALREERSGLFVKVCQGSPLRRLPFSGTIARMDLRHVMFEQCRFERVVWANCKFDESTVFDGCHFTGGMSVHCEGLGSAQWRGGTIDQEAAAWISGVRVKEGKQNYSTDELRADISSVVQKFLRKGSGGLKTIEETHLKRGSISASPYRDEILRELCSSVLEAHEISGTSGKGYHIKGAAEDAVKFYATNNVFTGPIQVAFDRLRKKLHLS